MAAIRVALRGYMNEKKRYATIAIGCTGGKHRSVAISRKVAEMLSDVEDIAIHLKHRDIGKE